MICRRNKQIITLLLFLIIFSLILLFVIDIKMGLIVALILTSISIFIKPEIGLGLLVFSLPFKMVGNIYIGFNFRLSYWIFALTLFAWLMHRFIKRDFKFLRTPLDFPLFLFLFIAVISVFQSRFIPPDAPILLGAFRNLPWIKSISRIFLLIFMIIIYYFIIHFVKNEKTIKYALLFLFISSVAVSIYGLYGFTAYYLDLPTHIGNWNTIVKPSPLILDPPRIRSTEMEPLFFGNYLLSIIPVALSLFFLKQKFISRRLLFLVIFVDSLALILTFSRGVWFAFIISILFFIIIQGRILLQNKKILISLGLIAIIIFLVFSPLLIPQITGVFNTSSAKFWSVKMRLISINYALIAFKNHPILGIGYENYNFYSGNKIYVGLDPNPINLSEPNNYPIKILAEMGIIGFVAGVWLYIQIILMVWRVIKKTKIDLYKNLATGYLVAFIGVTTQLLFFSTITFVYLWVMLGLIIAASKLVKNEKYI